MTGEPRPDRRWTERAGEVEAEVAAELDAHFQGTVDLLVERGWTEEDARAEAERRFGDVDRYRQTLERMARRRRMRRKARAVLGDLGGACVSAGRSVRRAPGLSAAVVVTLALGIGANAAIFRVVDRLLLSPPEHVARPHEVWRLHQMISREPGELNAMEAFTYGDVRALRAADLPVRFGAVAYGMPETLGEGDGAVRVRVARADSAYLPLLGVDAALGRAFTPDDHHADAPPVALLAHALWMSRFGSDPGVLGRTLRLGEGHYEVVGVLPEGFVGAEPPAVEVWLPLETTAPGLWGNDWAGNQGILAFRVLARLRPNADEGTLTDDARAVLLRSRDGYGLRGELRSVGTASLVPGDGPNPMQVVAVSRWLAGVALLVLLVACANVANLFLAQGERLRGETAVRLALGAGRGRIAGELLARALLLALLGAGGALALATWGGNVLDDLFLAGMELGARPRNGRLLLFVVGAAIGAATLSGLLPALWARGADLRHGLQAESRATAGGGRLRRALVGVQAALSAVLLVGALLFVLSLRAALRLDLGFDAEQLVTVRVEAEEGHEAAGLYRAGEDALLQAPGVASVTSTVAVPFQLLYGLSARLPDADSPPTSPGGERVTVNAVGERFFETMGVPVLRGRAIERGDLVEGAEPVAVVSPSAARLLWPGRDPLGRCIVVGRGEAGCARVVGVAAEHAGTSFSLPGDPAAAAAMMAWVPLPVAGRGSPSALLVRVEGDAAAAVARVRRRMLEIPGVRYAEIEPMATFVGRQTRSWRLGATVFSLFAVVALAVAAVGLYGVLAYDVARRRREIGIRMALGARRGRVVGGILLVALVTVGGGLAVALPLAVWVSGRLDALLFEVSTREPVVFALAAGILLVTAILAAIVPAWRATRVEPREALAEG